MTKKTSLKQLPVGLNIHVGGFVGENGSAIITSRNTNKTYNITFVDGKYKGTSIDVVRKNIYVYIDDSAPEWAKRSTKVINSLEIHHPYFPKTLK